MVREFNLMEKTYSRIFERLGLDFRIVEADSGAIGGNGSKEFMVLADSGEDTLAICNSCHYGANLEKATRKPLEEPKPKPEIEFFGKFSTPNMTKIDELAEFFHIDPFYLIKTVAKKAIYENKESEVVLFFLRGSDNLEETKAQNSVNALELVDATNEDLEKIGLVGGFLGPLNLDQDIKRVFDIELKEANTLIGGANEKDYHHIGIDLKHLPDYTVFSDIAEVREGDRCPVCGEPLEYKKGIETGHIFQLGTGYSEKLNANFLDSNGSSKPMVMGTYGIGVSRLVSAVVEQSHDDKGIILPKSVAPYVVNVMVSNIKDEEQLQFGEKLYSDLQNQKVSVILDDRKDRFGAKIKDAELIGFPYTVIVGKNLKDGKVQILDRAKDEKIEIGADDVLAKLEELI